ncbi:nucleotide exchange factor GrpE [Saccharopolyspora sp. NPDC000359]|uniref:nucleotide exchange factor GrpE n=1 Tax=Saccharopolyspora sp. NPDC000359 TaxID=3154251 RepID=UPI00331E76CF
MREEPEQDDQREEASTPAPVGAGEPAEDPPGRDPLAELTDAVAARTERVRQHHDRANARERVVHELHAEVERLRAGEQNLLLRPITTDLQNFREDLLHQARTLPPELSREQVVGLLESFALSAEQALERCGSAPIRPVGAESSAREHRAVKILPAAEPDQHERIAAVLSDGYFDTTTDRVTAPARVHVHRWSAATGNSAASRGDGR